MKVTKRFARHMVETTYRDLPFEVISKTKWQILDILGVMLPSTTLEKGCRVLEKITKDARGKEESTVIGFGGKAPSWMAAFVNGSLCHTLDYDDTIDEFPSHPSAHCFPAGLAVAESVGKISGKKLITAVALGIDFNVRLASSPRGSLLEDYPWFAISIFGLLSATATAAKILGVTVDQMVNALGIAVDRVSGMTESIMSPGSEIRAIGNAYANREGVLAALMAKGGITAYKDALEVLFRTYYTNKYDPSRLIKNLGKEYLGLRVSLKPWPCCRVTHSYVKAGLELVTKHNINSKDITEIVLTVGRFGRDILCSPIELQREPKLSINAKMSLPYIMGVVFAKRDVAIEDFLDENLRNEEILEIARKTNCKFDESLSKGAIGPGIVEVKLKSGENLYQKEKIPYGHPENPVSDKELITKFQNCAGYSKKTLKEKEVEYLIEQILRLEDIGDISEITEGLA